MNIRKVNRWENPEISGINRRESRTSFYLDSSFKLSLNGKWNFKLLENPFLVNDDIIKEPIKGYTKIEVPSVWQLLGYDQMWYTDVIYQFPIHPPFVPNNNPTGIYKRVFNLDNKWLMNNTILKFYGVDSAFDVYINNKYVGFSKVSRLPSEFDISKYVVEGNNDICVVVYKYSDGTYLEDQDEWWFSGIFRDVEIINEPKACIYDCVIKTDLDTDYLNGKLNIDISLSKDEDVECIILDTNKKPIFNVNKCSKDNKLNIKTKINNCDKWTCETPNLYTLQLHTKYHQVEIRFGFRKIEIIDNRICINGVPILFNGVNHHDFSCDKGRVINREDIKDDILLMKKFNINALRCSHYPTLDYLYDLCDEYGLYVIDETDLECDGCGYIENYNLISDDPKFEKAYVDRCTRMVDKDINHPSIVMWSLGNESGFGRNFYAMKRAILKKDKSRLVHYEGDPECKVSDVYTTMYTWSEKLIKIAKSKGKPHIMCEYAHSMGNGAGNIKYIQNIFRKYPRLCGGFIWEWYDHGIKSEDGKGNIYYKYGGDYGDFPNNSNFCIDGLLRPDRSISTALYEYKQAICPIEITKTKNIDEYRIKNWFNFVTTGDYYVEYEFKCLNEVLFRDKFDIDIKPNKTKTIKIPFNYLYPANNHPVLINFIIKQNKDNLYASRGHEIGRYQFIVRRAKSEICKEYNKYIIKHSVKNNKAVFTVSNIKAVFDLIYGRLDGLYVNGEKVIVDGPEMSVFRANIDNDINYQKDWMNKYFIQLPSEQLEAYEIKDNRIIMHKYFSCLSQSWGYYVDYEYKFLDNGFLNLRIHAKDSQIAKLEPSFLPRLGIVMNINKKNKYVSYYGLGPLENYVDSKECAYYDVFNTDVNKMFVKYVYPQENGHRESVKWLSLSNKDDALLIQSKNEIGFNYSPYSDMKIENAKHTIDLIEDDFLTLHLDAYMSGLGSNSCGQEQLKEHKVMRRSFDMDINISSVKREVVIDEVKKIRK